MKERIDLLRLKEVLKHKGMPGYVLAEKVNVTPNTISNIVKGNNFPSPELLSNIALVLDVDIRELFKSTKDDLYPIFDQDGQIIGYLKK